MTDYSKLFPLLIRKNLYYFFLCIAILAIALAFLALLLSGIYFVTQVITAEFGYPFRVSDSVKVGLLTIGGACIVAILAFFGVQTQNLSAERRHKTDANLQLRKDVLRQVTEAFSDQYKFLLSFSNPHFTEKKRQKLIKECSTAFFKLQLIGSQETIIAMIEANEAWGKAASVCHQSMQNCEDPEINSNNLKVLLKIVEATTPYMQKLWVFNTLCRKEIDCGFENDQQYLQKMNEYFGRMETYVLDLIKLAENEESRK